MNRDAVLPNTARERDELFNAEHWFERELKALRDILLAQRDPVALMAFRDLQNAYLALARKIIAYVDAAETKRTSAVDTAFGFGLLAGGRRDLLREYPGAEAAVMIAVATRYMNRAGSPPPPVTE